MPVGEGACATYEHDGHSLITDEDVRRIVGLFNRRQEPHAQAVPIDVIPRFPDRFAEDILDAAGYPKTPGNIDMVLRTACQTAATTIHPLMARDSSPQRAMTFLQQHRWGVLPGLQLLQSLYDDAVVVCPKLAPELGRRAAIALRVGLSAPEAWTKLER